MFSGDGLLMAMGCAWDGGEGRRGRGAQGKAAGDPVCGGVGALPCSESGRENAAGYSRGGVDFLPWKSVRSGGMRPLAKGRAFPICGGGGTVAFLGAREVAKKWTKYLGRSVHFIRGKRFVSK